MGFQLSDIEAPGSVSHLTPKELRSTPRTIPEESTQSELPKDEQESNSRNETKWAQIKNATKKAHRLSLYVESLFLHPVTQALVTRGRQKKNMQPKEESAQEIEKSFLGRHEGSGGTQLVSSVVCLDCDLLKDAIKELHTAATAFVIFESEKSRDDAVDKLKENGFAFRFATKE